MRILVLSTWFPYPPNQGSTIRAYQLIRSLAEWHEVALVSFANPEIQPEWITHMQGVCKRVEVVHHNPFSGSRLRSALGLFSATPSSMYAGYSAEMQSRVLQTADEWKPDLIFCLTIITAPYALKVKGVRRIVDIDNLLSRYLREIYEGTQGQIRRMRRWFAWQKLWNYEKSIFQQFDLCLAVSQADKQWASKSFSVPLERIVVVPNGVQCEENAFQQYSPQENSLVFSGSLTYEPNLDAMLYFVQEILPLVRQKVSGAHLSITGRYDGVPLQWMPDGASVQLTGFVDNIRQVVGESWACVVPLRLGAGTRIKILEAMALGTPVITTSKGAEGLDVETGRHLLIADTREEFAEQTIHLLCDYPLRQRLAKEARQLVQDSYNWIMIGQNLCRDITCLEAESEGKERTG